MINIGTYAEGGDAHLRYSSVETNAPQGWTYAPEILIERLSNGTI